MLYGEAGRLALTVHLCATFVCIAAVIAYVGAHADLGPRWRNEELQEHRSEPKLTTIHCLLVKPSNQ
jgi:hypothetical protein